MLLSQIVEVKGPGRDEKGGVSGDAENTDNEEVG